MQDFDFDFAVIGGGSAGYAAARTAHAGGLHVAVIDGAAELGGLCILRGCMPSKTLIESADRNLIIRHAGEFGLRAEAGAPDVSAIRARKRRLIHEFASYRQGQLEDGRWDLIRGHATFLDPHSVSVKLNDGHAPQTVRARSFCIASGSVPNLPPIPGLADCGYWTSDELLEAEDLPDSFVILGGGAIALEAAHYLEGVGRKVTLIQRNRQLLTGLDPECGDVIVAAYRRRGMAVHCDTQVHSIRCTENGREIDFSCAGARCKVVAAQVLVALGRGPNAESLDLAAARVSSSGGKVHVTATQQTTQPHIFAAGDVCSPLDVVHVAIQQGEVAARNAKRLLSGAAVSEEMDYRLILFGVFSHPQVAIVGANEQELRQRGVPFVGGTYPFNDHGKSLVMGEIDGFVKMLAHQHTGEILGAACVGPHATELIHEVVVAMHHRCTARDFVTIPHYHPTLSEIWTYPAEECADQVGAAADA